MRFALLVAIGLLLAACSDANDTAGPTATIETTETVPTATASPAATDTPEPMPVPAATPEGGPDASGERALEHLRYIATETGPRTGGSSREMDVAEYVAHALRHTGKLRKTK